MGILDQISNSNARCGIRFVVGGAEKIGKTTLLASAPRPLLIPLEVGFAGVRVNKTPMLESFDQVIDLLDEITATAQTGKFPYMTLCIDSATALERLIHLKVLEMDPNYVKDAKGNKKAVTMESALGGYGKAYTFANELFASFLAKCDALAIHGGINILLTCHVFAAEVVDPTAGAYNSWDLLLHSPKNQKTYGKREMLTQWADVIGFLHEPVFVTEGKQMNKAVSKNEGRILAMTRTPGYVAGNRFGVVDNISLPKDGGWNHIAQAIYAASGLDYFNRDTV
jgi:hypothetical protein